MRSMEKILEVNVDDLYSGGVFSLVKNVIINKPHSLQMDIATFEKFEKKKILTCFPNITVMFSM